MSKIPNLVPGVLAVLRSTTGGAEVGACIREAIGEAKHLGCHVGFIHNGVFVLVDADSDPDEVGETWNRRISSSIPYRPVW